MTGAVHKVDIYIFILLIFIYISKTSSQPCPRACSGHGLCNSADRICKCQDGFEGPDCSMYICPMGAAWADKASATDIAHNPAVCSNMGTCDTMTGSCLCKAGFEGVACERIACPLQCNSRVYTTIWDADKIYGCSCDEGFTGPDCSRQTCPTGDDPLTGSGKPTKDNPAQSNHIQQVQCAASGGSFTLSFRGKTTAPIDWTAQAFDIVSALEALPTINGVIVGLYGAQACATSGTSFTVEFKQDFGVVPLMKYNAAQLTQLPGSSTRKGIIITNLAIGSKEDLPCSRRGICDATSGSCQCSTNFDSSNGYNLAGTRGDCGYAFAAIQGCPGSVSCSAHGACSGAPTFVCACNDGWQGADCSEKTCPTGPSWFTSPSADNTAHVLELEECCNMGTCDHSSGTCTCIPGFTGAACDRLQCPGDPNLCNGHGECQDMATLATYATKNGVNLRYTYGLIPNNVLTWDFNRIQGCNCNGGWTGYDCSLRTCSLGDNPDTVGQFDEIQSIQCVGDGTAAGAFFILGFRDEVTDPIPASASTSAIKDALETLEGINVVAVDLASNVLNGADQLCTTSGANTFYVSFLTEHGNLPLMTFTKQGEFDMQVNKYRSGSKENIECSGKGLCDRTTGSCNCFVGYGSSDGSGNFGTIADCGFILPFALNE